MVTKGRPGPTPQLQSALATPDGTSNGTFQPYHAVATSNGNIFQEGAADAGISESAPADVQKKQQAVTSDANGTAAPDTMAPIPGQANPQRPPDAPGEVPTERDAQKRKEEDQLVANAHAIRAVRKTLALAKEKPLAEPCLPLNHWDFLLREATWLAVDVSQAKPPRSPHFCPLILRQLRKAQERLWKRNAAKQLAREAAIFVSKAQLSPAQGQFGQEVRNLKAGIQQDKQEDAKQTRRSQRDRADSGKAASTRQKSSEESVFSGIDADAELAPSTPPPVGDSIFHYLANVELLEATAAAMAEAADDAAIAQELRVREHEYQYERSLQEAREQALAARRQIASELRGDDTNAVDFDDDYGKKNRRKKARPLWDELEQDLLPPAKRVSSQRKQQHSRPDSTISDEARRDLEAGVETSGRREREVKRKKRIREYDDEDYEEPLRTRESNKRKAPTERGDRRVNLRSDQRTLRSKRGSGLGQRHGSRGALDAEGLLPWTQAEDNLLCSIVHEFGSNWRLVADILSTSCAMSGLYRAPQQCRARFRELAAPHTAEGQEIQEQVALEALRINKTFARDLINKSLPAPDAVLQLHQKVLLQLALAAKEKRARARQQERQNSLQQTEPHPTILAAQEQALRTNQGRIPTPLQLIEANDAQQQALAAQQLAQQQQQAAAQQAAAAAAAAPPVAPGASGGAAIASGGASSAANLLAGEGSVARQGSINSQQQQQQQQQQQSLQPSPQPQATQSQPSPQQAAQNAMSQAPAASAAAFAATGGAMPPPASVAQQPQRPQITMQQIQQILSSGRMPNGQEVNGHIRGQLVARLQAMQRAAAAAAAAGGRVMQPGVMQQGGPQIGMPSPHALQQHPPASLQRQPGAQSAALQMAGGQMQAVHYPQQPGQSQGGQLSGPAAAGGGTPAPQQTGQPGGGPSPPVSGITGMGVPSGGMAGLTSPQKPWPPGMAPRMQQQMQGLRPQGVPPAGGQGLAPGMSQPMQAGMNPALAQAQGRPPMPGMHPQSGTLQQPPQ